VISAIAIISKNRGLGKDNKLLFHIPGELPRFKKITMGHPIIMGRKTFESIGRSLPGRLNIIVSRTSYHTNPTEKSLMFARSVEEAIQLARETTDTNEIFIIGGGQIFQEAMPVTDRLYLTVVDKEVEADTFFPDYSDFTKVIEKEDHHQDGYDYTFLTLER